MAQTSWWPQLIRQLIKHGLKYCQAICELNCVAPLEFCEGLEETGETFDNVVFTDESSIWFERHNKLRFRRKRDATKAEIKSYASLTRFMSGLVSRDKATKILIFTGIIKRVLYIESILRDTVLPFLSETIRNGHRFSKTTIQNLKVIKKKKIKST